jgi:hypothetical protein
LGYRVVLICFAESQQRVDEWWELVNIRDESSASQSASKPFLVLLDPEKTVYQRYGMKRSFWQTWTFGTLLYYGYLILTRKWKYRKNKEDPNQLGGDFVIDLHGRLLLVHPSQSPIDRVSIMDILNSIPGGQERVENVSMAPRVLEHDHTSGATCEACAELLRSGIMECKS